MPEPRGMPKRGVPKRGSPSGNREAPTVLHAAREKAVITIVPEELTASNESANILIHGNSGVGKTTLIGSAPRAVFLSTEQGTISAKRTGSKAQLIRALDWDTIQAGIAWAYANLTSADWLLVDSLTKMQILMIRGILSDIHEENDTRDLDIPGIQDHQKWQNMFMRFVDKIVDGPFNSILVTTSMIKEDPEGESIVLPSITGKDYTISNYVCAQMDEVFYLDVAPRQKNEPTVRRLRTQTFPPYFAKDRYGIFPRRIDIPDGEYDTMARLIEQIGNS